MQKFVAQLMEVIELDGIKDSLVEIPRQSGLSTEQHKRLTNAAELVFNPSIMFMDEAISGLHAKASAIVMGTVMNKVTTGRTTVCTIHQPSIDIFEAFDPKGLGRNASFDLFSSLSKGNGNWNPDALGNGERDGVDTIE
ncbi:hypothetical protein RHSIM_Rhsim08G0132700 [Rhododendron simsii]|uniref:ABC transporter family G domain-containing protein n=1 Tax=Rhododendron simsii TaxID=118357 RepID=A0A834LDV2_RHOSS|nr:hypothetical protein RHSIM_Rhsim08G0132700 [Rhododendron simsii]